MADSSTILRAGAWGALLLASSALTAPALAQQLPRFIHPDGNGVDLVTGEFGWSMTEGTIGSGEGQLSLVRNWSGGTRWTDNWSGTLYTITGGGTSTIIVDFGNYSDRFTVSGGTYTSTKADGATLTALSGGIFRYVAADGTRIDFASQDSYSGSPLRGRACDWATNGTCAVPVSIIRPNGMTYTLNWDMLELCYQMDAEEECQIPAAYVRFRGVTNSANYAIAINYADDYPAGPLDPGADWFRRTQAQFTNLDGAPGSLPTVTYTAVSSTVTDVTDTAGQTWRLTNGGPVNLGSRLTGIRRPGAGSDTMTIAYYGNVVSSVVNEGVTTTYAWSGTTTRTATITDANSGQTVVISSPAAGRVTSITDPLSRTTTFQFDGNSRETRQTMPEGNSISYSYDARGNVTEIRMREKDDTSDTGDDIVTTASYDSSCANVVTCNQPNSVTDARGNTTDFTYDSTHGGVLTATAPPPSGSGDRPQTRHSYTQVTAVTGQPVYLLTEVSACASGTSPTCVGTANEARTVTAYDTDNLRVTSTTARNGDNTVSSTSAFTYDAIGNLLTVDGPLSGSADTTRFRYDTARRLIGTIAPDPDSTGSLVHRAERQTYTNGLLTKVESGTVNSQSDGDWAAFSAAQRIEQDYDANGRPIQRRLMSGSTTYSVSQTSYDSLGRVQCQAERMNPAEFASLTGDACALDTEGSGGHAYGPDRITRAYYDAGSRITQIRTAYGVSGQESQEANFTYSTNGQVLTVADANGNVSAYQYDGFDRRQAIFYPNASGGGTSSSDSETFGYTADLLTSRTDRAGATQTLAYDNLGRITSRDLPGAELTVSYTYDLMGRTLTALTSSQTLTFTWDALGRNLTQVGPHGTATSAYDAAGRRTSLTYPGSGPVIGYTYDVASNITEIRENPSGSNTLLATYAYDSLGRRSSLTRGNGTTTSYGYDNVSRLSQVVHDLDGGATTNDLTLGYSYNPASQIVQTTRSNDVYAWGGHYAVNRSYTANGRNQYTAVGGNTPTHDSNGNVTFAGPSGTPTFAYNSENLLASTSTGVTLSYDPATRLYETVGGSTTRRAYDGDTLIADYNGSNTLQARYVFGPGGEPLVRYDVPNGSARYYYHQDERGSVIAQSTVSGAMASINAYDEYGIPASGNTGRFQYTGQQWLPELGMQYSRARIYSPTWGRFVQTDPIGFEGGMNLYGYVRNDPVNLIDPLGLQEAEPEQTIVVTGARFQLQNHAALLGGSSGANGGSFLGGGEGGGSGGTPGSDDNYEKYEEDIAICNSLGTSAAREACFRSAMERYAARLRGRREEDLVTWGRVATGVGAAVVIYWIISIGSRILFPPRNLVPIP